MIGKSGYFIKNHNENPELSEIFKGFKGNYLNVVKIMFLMNLKYFYGYSYLLFLELLKLMNIL